MSELIRAGLETWDRSTAPDLHQFFGLDDERPSFWRRPWRSLVGRMVALLDVEGSRLSAEMTRRQEAKKKAEEARASEAEPGARALG